MTGPRPAFDPAPTGGQCPLAGGEVGQPRRHHQRARPDAVERLTLVVLVAAEPVRVRLLVAGEGLCDDGDPGQPLHVRHPVPAGHDQPEREAVLGEERRAVHLVGEQHVVAERLFEGKAALEDLLLAALVAAVEPGEDHLPRAIDRPRLGEQRRERRAAPGRGADRLGEPRLADRPRAGEEGAPVAGALRRHFELDRGPRPEVVERELERPRDEPADRQLEPRRVDERDVVVDQQVVQPDRRDRVAERLERHPVVAGSELELDLAERLHAERTLPRATAGRAGCPSPAGTSAWRLRTAVRDRRCSGARRWPCRRRTARWRRRRS